MPCPRCGHPAEDGEPTCARCGVVFAKLQRARPARSPAPAQAHSRAGWVGPAVALAAGLLGGYALFRGPSPPQPAASPAPQPAIAPVADAAEDSPPSMAPAPLPRFEVPPAQADGADARLAQDLAGRVETGRVRPGDVQEAERLARAHPEQPGLAGLHAAALVVRGNQEAGARRFAEAGGLYEEALTVKPDLEAALLGLMAVRLEQARWSEAEQAARRVLSITPLQPRAMRSLGYALLRQDRDREAREALEAALQVEEDPQARAWLAHLDKTGSDEAGMRAQNLAHFHVRYDGEAHEDVGREVLRLLDRHYARLVTTLDHQPAAPIPVVLFSRDAYYSASGAPFWSGGVYSHFDGRIRIPIGGLGSNLTPDLEGVLLHEVTHAFLGEMSGGVVPRDVNEGFAQYMEGKRASDAELRALASGRLPLSSVPGFYLGALSFVEHLMGARGQGGMNDLLRAMGEVRDADEAFRRVHGSDSASLKQAWWSRLRAQYGK